MALDTLMKYATHLDSSFEEDDQKDEAQSPFVLDHAQHLISCLSRYGENAV